MIVRVPVKQKAAASKVMDSEQLAQMEKLLGAQISHLMLETELVKVRSDMFHIVEDVSVAKLNKMFKPVDMGRIYMMIPLVQTQWNIVCQEGTMMPHTRKTLMELFGVSRTPFDTFLKSLISKGVLYSVKGKTKGKRTVSEYFIFNPTIARKRSVMMRKTFGLFEDFTKVKSAERDIMRFESAGKEE